MDKKTEELIAIGAAVTAHCLPCLKVHKAKAEEAGASPDDIADAIRVGREVRQGSTKLWDQEANALL